MIWSVHSIRCVVGIQCVVAKCGWYPMRGCEVWLVAMQLSIIIIKKMNRPLNAQLISSMRIYTKFDSQYSLKIFHKNSLNVTTSFVFVFFLNFCCIFILLSRESDQCAIRARLGVANHPSTTLRSGNPTKCLFQRHNK